jgi:hypothetical protein
MSNLVEEYRETMGHDVLHSWAEDAVEELKQLKKRNEQLREALIKISNPIGYFQKEAEKEGRKINGLHAVTLANDPSYLSKIATEALEGEQS